MTKANDVGSSTEHLRCKYDAVLPAANRLAAEMAHQIEFLIQREGIQLAFPLQHRVKTFPSVSEKLQRTGIVDVRMLNDLVGFRIIVQFSRDIERVCGVLTSAFVVLEKYDTIERLGEDQFGYSSVHLVVRTPATWGAVPALAGLEHLNAEIQVRTTAQHIWAAASHVLQYKNEQSVPPAVRRSIYRVSALLETIDLEFERVLQEREAYKAVVAVTDAPTERLNVDLLQQVLDETWPKEAKWGTEDYAELLDELFHFGIDTRAKLGSLLAKHHDDVLHEHAQLGGYIRTGAPQSLGLRDTNARAGYPHVGLTRRAIRREFGDDVFEQYRRERDGVPA